MKFLLLFSFFASMLAVGFFSKSHATDVSGFVLGNRTVGPWLTSFAYGTSYFSAVIFIGYAGQFGWRFGLSATWIGIGNAILGSALAWIVLGKRTHLISQKLNSTTMPDFFEKRFGSKSLRYFSAVLIFIFLIPYTASLYNGLSRLFSMAFSIDYTLCILIMAGLTAIYVIVGGYMATAINDFIQGIIMLIGIVIIVLSVLSINGGLIGSLSALSQYSSSGDNIQKGMMTSIFGPDPINLFSVILLTSFGTWGLPQMVQKFYAIKDEQSIKKGTIISTIFAFIVAGGCYFLGSFGRLFESQIDIKNSGYDSIVPTMLSHLPKTVVAIAIVLVLSASMSTLSSLVLASSSTLTLDLIGELKKDLNEHDKLRIIRIFTAIFVLISAIVAIIQYKGGIGFIAQLMGISWGSLAGAFLAPFLFGLYWEKTSTSAVWVSFIVGPSIMIINMLFRPILPTIFQSPINAGVLAMIVGMILVPIISLIDMEKSIQPRLIFEKVKQSL